MQNVNYPLKGALIARWGTIRGAAPIWVFAIGNVAHNPRASEAIEKGIRRH